MLVLYIRNKKKNNHKQKSLIFDAFRGFFGFRGGCADWNFIFSFEQSAVKGKKHAILFCRCDKVSLIIKTTAQTISEDKWSVLTFVIFVGMAIIIIIVQNLFALKCAIILDFDERKKK